MTNNVANVTDEMRNLKDSVDQTLTSMNEVTTGSAESAEAIQQQMMKTNEIQAHIDDVTRAAEVINKNVKTTAEAVKEGQRHVEDMNKLTKQVDTAGKDVAAALQTFQDTTAQMNSITDLITNVSHDLKTPLTSIINYVDLLKRLGIQDQPAKGYIDILENKAQRLKEIGRAHV